MSRHARVWLIFLLCVVGILYLSGLSYMASTVATPNQILPVNPNSTQGKDLSYLQLDYAATPEKRNTGLMYRLQLCENCGMLFIFESSQPMFFWMKNTYLDLDIIYVTADGRVLNIAQAQAELLAKSDPEYPSYRSEGEALYVLEMNQGWSERNNLRVGDMIKLDTLLVK